MIDDPLDALNALGNDTGSAPAFGYRNGARQMHDPVGYCDLDVERFEASVFPEPNHDTALNGFIA